VRIRLGTRGSTLARAQAGDVARSLAELGHEVEMVLVKTTGDAKKDVAFPDAGALGVFVKELEHALREGRIDLAVHSYKDVPGRESPDLLVAAVPERAAPEAVLVTRGGSPGGAAPLATAAQGACIGTASQRRSSWVRHLRPDLSCELLRGNVTTRLQRLREGRYEGILLAAAGIDRLRAASGEGAQGFDTDGLDVLPLSCDVFVPAPSQGALALQVRAGDGATGAAVAVLDNARTRREVAAERAILRLAESGCTVPFGAFCRTLEDGALELLAMRDRDGTVRRAHGRGPAPDALAREVHERLEAGP